MAVAGGLTPASVGDIKVIDMANVAVTSMAAFEKSQASYKLVKIVSAETQVVAGMAYKLVLDVTKDGRPAKLNARVLLDLRGTKKLMEATVT